jgi:hypothetical protein
VSNYYELIGVARTATAAEIKTRYRALSKSYHPDAGGSEQQMAQLNQAYRVLINPLDRATYDRGLNRERDAARAAAAYRQRATQRTHAQTTAKHTEARAYAQQQSQKSTKKSGFWKFIAWGTAAYVVIGLAIVYALTMPTTAGSDTATDSSTPATTLAQEAANASANVPETPTSVTQTTPSTADDSGVAEQADSSNTQEVTQPDTAASSDTQTCQQASDTHAVSCGATQHETHRRPNWRNFLPF